MVKGLGETLVGAYPGRALSFVCKKSDLNSPQVILQDRFVFVVFCMVNSQVIILLLIMSNIRTS